MIKEIFTTFVSKNESTMRKGLLIAALLTLTPTLSEVMADDYATLHEEKIQNPMLWADVPDPDVIRVGDTYIFSAEKAEGSRMIKHNGKYYLLMISHTYAPGRHRR